MNQSDPSTNIPKQDVERILSKSDTHIASKREIASVYISFQVSEQSRIQSVPNLESQDEGSTENRNDTMASNVGTSNREQEVKGMNSEPTNPSYLESSDGSEDIIIKPNNTISLYSVNLNDIIETIQVQQNIELQELAIPSLTSSESSAPKVHSSFKRQRYSLNESSEEKFSRISKSRTTHRVPQVNSSLTMGGRRCRICMSCGTERLISPCHCKGSLGVIHVSCLERWLSTSGRASCELCGYSFPVIMTQRYSVLRALYIWLRFSRNRTTFMTDCLFFWTLTVLTTSLVVCCIMGSKYFMEQGNTVGMPRALAEGMTDVLLAVVICGYAITTYVLWKDHATLWRRWRLATMDVRLVLEDLQHNSDDEDEIFNSKPESEQKT